LLQKNILDLGKAVLTIGSGKFLGNSSRNFCKQFFFDTSWMQVSFFLAGLEQTEHAQRS
jgi:hypothetical protein